MQCDSALLWTIIEQDAEPGEEAESIARHLESCSRCREELSKLGGEETWWDDAQHWLSRADLEEIDHDAPPQLPPVDLGFLEPPAHPEMLGRIGRYDVEGLLGCGGMGVVLRAYDSDLRRSVAVKVLAPHWAASMPARQRFAREAQAAASVAHENVIPIYNVEADAPLPFLVMRYIPGMTLERWVRQNGPPDAATILRVAGQLAEGLAAAHRRGLVHRDIKPGNVLVGENIDRVWITDFGLARAADSITLTRTGVIAGTPHYMSPEQARGEPVDGRSDLFSLGCVLYFLSAGQPPFDAENTLAVLHKIVSSNAAPLTTLRDDLPPSFASTVHRLLQRSPDRRPQDCEAVLEMLNEAQKENRLGRVARRPLTRRARASLAIAATVTCGLLLMLTHILAPAAIPWTTHRSTEAVPVNPWDSVGTLDRVNVSPYVQQAAAEIGTASIVDQATFEREIQLLDAQVNQLSQPESMIAPNLIFDDKQWRQKVAEVERLINEANRR